MHARDHTGQEIERVLIEQAEKSNSVEVIENGLVLDLIVQDNECLGVYYYDEEEKKVIAVLSNVTLIATGGIGQVYKFTTNPPIATGDGIAMAYRAGAKIANMEFVQFHPTAVYNVAIDGRAFLVTEATRGEGGILKTKDGKTFMERYHPMGCLAPRDVVARACYAEMKKRGEEFCLLDLTHLNAEWVRERFPLICETLLKHGIDITRQPIPVVPVAHYLCGGIKTDTEARSSIERLFSAGEAACSGVHGANRLASNSLLEALVFASRGAEKALSYHKAEKAGLDFKYEISDREIPHSQGVVKEIMQNCGGIVRNMRDLTLGLGRITELVRSLPRTIRPEDMVIRNMLEIGFLVLKSASLRRESRGLHYMEDFPRMDKMLEKDTLIDIYSKSTVFAS